MPFGNLIGARLFLHFGYYVTFAASGFFAFSGAVYVAVVLKETVVKGPKGEKEKQSICQVAQNIKNKNCSKMFQVLMERNPLTIVRSLVKRRSGLRRELILCSFFTLSIHNLYYKVIFYFLPDYPVLDITTIKFQIS